MSDPRTLLEREIGAAQVSSLGALPLAEPRDEEQLCALLRLATREHLCVLPLGFGTKLAWRASSVADFALTTRALSGIVEYEPDEGVITARAGTTLAHLRARTAAERHWLTPFVAREERTSLGGAISAGQSGLDRLRFGPLRHHVLGLRVALGDGTVVKSGGRLVKNVTGYDMHRLYTGAHGSLCVVLEASLRLFSAPRRYAWLQVPGEGREWLEAAWRGAIRPLILALGRVENGWELGVLLGGAEEVVAEELALVQHAATLEGEAALTAARTFANTHTPEGACTRLECLPTGLGELLSRARGRCLVLPGVVTAQIEGAPPAAERPQRTLDRRIKQALDPHGVLAEVG
ncbi:MAG: FAD-binding oxidoreductase [Planctomycetes bacterium]|nr:FAD-binding oxidoreductase [Planctomycetota bacterium]